MVGIFYEAEKRDSEGKLVKRGRWIVPNNEGLETANYAIGELFDYITRKGNMLRREIQYTNLDVNFVDVIIPHSIIKKLEFITSSLKYINEAGKEVIDKTKELQRHQEAVEEYKLDEVVRLTKKEIAEGRNVIIFTSMVDEGIKEREDGSTKIGSVRILKNRLSELYGTDAVGVLVSASGEYEKYRRLENIDSFQKGTKRILIPTITSGGTGTNLDDQLGNAPRTIICVTAPLSFINIMQGIGRVVRANTKSRSRAFFTFAKTDHPDKNESTIPVELWLKNLIASKFKTLHAAVKGEVSILNPEEVQRIESAGESGTATLIEQNNSQLSAREHSLYTKTGGQFNGWQMPTPSAIAIERVGNNYEHKCYIRARTKEELYAWIESNKNFIEQWELEYNFDKNYRRYNGSHIGKTFRTANKKEWRESYELWNAMLNLIKPEESKYLNNETIAYKVGDKIQATTDILSSDTKINDIGKIIEIIPVSVGKNEHGDIKQFRYDVEWSNKKISISLFAWQIKPLSSQYDKKSKYKVNDTFVGYFGEQDKKNIYKTFTHHVNTSSLHFDYSSSDSMAFKVYKIDSVEYNPTTGQVQYSLKTSYRNSPVNVLKFLLRSIPIDLDYEETMSEEQIDELLFIHNKF